MNSNPSTDVCTHRPALKVRDLLSGRSRGVTAREMGSVPKCIWVGKCRRGERPRSLNATGI